MTTQTRDRLPILIPLGMAAILGAVFIGSTLARTTQQSQPATTASPSPVSSTVPTVSPSPVSSPATQTINTGAFVRVKPSDKPCQPAFVDAPNVQELICFKEGRFLVTGLYKDFAALSDGTNKFWMQTSTLEPVTEKPPEQLLPPEPQTNWN
jgi:hypothetical protein